MPNLVVLFGPPASGKAAVGHELARLAGYRFFHNHLTVDPVAALFGWENERFPRTLERVRDVLFEEVVSDETIAGVVFTFVWALELREDTAYLERLARRFARSGGSVHFVELTASLPVRLAREGTPFRTRLKPSKVDVEAMRAHQLEVEAKHRMNTGGRLPLPYPHFVVDTERHGPRDAALRLWRSLQD